MYKIVLFIACALAAGACKVKIEPQLPLQSPEQLDSTHNTENGIGIGISSTGVIGPCVGGVVLTPEGPLPGVGF